MHCISHHLYPNTELDYEVAAFEPVTFYLRSQPENSWVRVWLLEVLFFFLQPLNMTFKLLVSPIIKKRAPDFLYSFPFVILAACIWNSVNVW